MFMLNRFTLLMVFCVASVSYCTAQSASTAASAYENCPSITASNEGLINTTYFDATLDDRITAFLSELESVAGLAIAVVHENEVIYERGFGYRDLAACLPVLPDTRFYLKSTTKSFLGVLAAVLHEEGSLELDAPITEYLPDLSPPGIQASHLTIRQHLTHGIPYSDSGLNYLSAYAGMDEADYIGHINIYGRAKTPRFQYSNFGPIIAGHAAGAATGVNWRDLIEEKIFAPLGMASSFTHVGKATDGPAAQVYILGQNKRFEPTVLKSESQMHAAGGAFSTVEDLSRWLIASLNNGLIDGEQAIPARAFQQAHARQINLDWTYYKFHRFAHGFGHYSADYEGDLLMHHFGGETHVSFMPEHGQGVVVLSNQIHGGSLTTHRLAALLYDTLLDKNNMEERWATAKTEIAESIERIHARYEEEINRLNNSAPSHDNPFPPSQLEGYYVNNRIGDIDIVVNNGALTMQYGALKGRLDAIAGNAYLAYFDPWGQPPVRFVFEQEASTDTMQINWGGRIFTRK